MGTDMLGLHIVFHNGVSPFSELYSALVIYLKAHSNNHLQVIVLNVACNLPITFRLNYPEIPDGCLSFVGVPSRVSG